MRESIRKTVILLTFIASLASCNNSTTSEQVVEEQSADIIKTKPEEKFLTNFTKEDVARFAISSLMGQPSETMKVKTKYDKYYVSYVRKSDAKKFDYKVKVHKNNVVWASIDGRWRSSKYDEKITFEEIDNKLKIIQTFSDGSIAENYFDKGQ